MNEDTDKFLRLEIGGKDQSLWEKLRPSLLKSIESLFNTEIDTETGNTLKDELQKFTSLLLQYGKDKLAKPGIDNAKTVAEIELMYSQKLKTQAEARKINAEAAEKEFDFKVKKLKITLQIAKASMIASANEQDIFFIKEIDSFLATVNAIAENSSFE